jgi:hypothetical protein
MGPKRCADLFSFSEGDGVMKEHIYPSISGGLTLAGWPFPSTCVPMAAGGLAC